LNLFKRLAILPIIIVFIEEILGVGGFLCIRDHGVLLGCRRRKTLKNRIVLKVAHKATIERSARGIRGEGCDLRHGASYLLFG
jgi:hypothetical protein